MAVHYAFETTEGVVHRRLLIPENPEENLRGETYDQPDIDWLHESERSNTILAFQRIQAEAVQAEKEAPKLLKVWTERADGTVVQQLEIKE